MISKSKVLRNILDIESIKPLMDLIILFLVLFTYLGSKEEE
jgi:hypothetical protein